MRWPFTRPAPEKVTGGYLNAPPAPTGLRKFDTFTPAEVLALPKWLRREVVADRRARVTASLERFVAAKEAQR